MSLEAEKVIPHSAEAIVTAYTTKDFHEHLASKVGSELKSFEVMGTGDGGYTITSVQTMSVDRLPDFAKRFAKGGVTVTVTDSWGTPDAEGSRRSDTTVDIAGAPVKAVASQTLHVRGDNETKAVVRGDVDVKVPLLGKKLKSAAEPYMAKFVNLQAKEVTAWLKQNGQ